MNMKSVICISAGKYERCKAVEINGGKRRCPHSRKHKPNTDTQDGENCTEDGICTTESGDITVHCA
jgi:hypothetical protein